MRTRTIERIRIAVSNANRYPWRCVALAMLAACLLPNAAMAQPYPSKAMRLIVRAPPGGTDDLIARLIAPAISRQIGQQVIVDYRPGAGGLVAWEYIAKQPPDGYTLLLAASGLAAIKSLRQGVTLDPFKDIGWVTQVTSFMLVLTVHPSLPAKSASELIALARKRPGELSYGSSGVGATPHLAAEYFKSMAKVDINHIPYKGAGPMYLDLFSGRIEMGSAVLGGALPHIRSGKVRPIGVSGAARSAQAPDIPTLAEGGVKGYAFEPFYALVVAAGTPREIMAALADHIGKALMAPEFRAQFVKVVASEVQVNAPEVMLQTARKEADLIETIVRTAGIKVE
ncbi:MAG: tripartite tricarboxylate transporter substrate binding protein [Burkholderiales bacterium]|nr:tripartite tricarboxylate transporter substrate binding protein [Burkholderiales bacterium]